MLNEIYGGNSQWLKADDLGDSKPVVVIESAEVRENTYQGETKKQIVLKFQGKEKLLGLNFTNASTIAELTGSQNYQDWIGTAIKLYRTTTKMANGSVAPCIRIFPELPNTNGNSAQSVPPPAPAFTGSANNDDDSIPF